MYISKMTLFAEKILEISKLRPRDRVLKLAKLSNDVWDGRLEFNPNFNNTVSKSEDSLLKQVLKDFQTIHLMGV